ncbi:hypothetical protein [Microvirga terricola]|uniref:Uncharacterized protein n=1 Tax=Microvirga terricola TaxID=2719797 RepID=A0ABX0VA00_9HYPH|nr:hypothetical protein [Microvirga terricola]NIX76528.1 hypothetical protein [Microvirga terricola]
MPFLLFAFVVAFLVLASGNAQAQDDKGKDDRRRELTFTALDTSSICDDCSIVQVSGTFSKNTTKAYYDFVWRGRFKKKVYFIFDSPGGSMTAAGKLGETLRILKAKTIVGRAVIRNGEVEIDPGTCASACVVAYVGGTTRSMPKDSRLGVHSWMPDFLLKQENGQENSKEKKSESKPMDQNSVEGLHRFTAAYLRHLDTMGVDLRLAVLALATPYRSIAWVSPRNQSLWSVVTIDSALSTPSDRQRPVLFLEKTTPPVAAEKPGTPRRNPERASL